MAETEGTVFRNPETGELATWNGRKWIITPPPERRAGPGPLGLVSPEIRTAVEERLGRRTGMERFMAAGLPSTIGTVIGAGAGSLLGPAGTIAGGAGGGAIGELIAQEIGAAPQSNLALGMAGAAPIAGPLIGTGLRMGGQATRAGLRQMAPVRGAVARRELQTITKEVESLGANILSSQTGVKMFPQGHIRAAVNRMGQTLERSELKNTLGALDGVTKEIVSRGLAEVPHGQQALRLIEGIKAGMFSPLPSPILRAGEPGKTLPATFDRYLSLRSEVGQAVKAFESQAGVKLGSAKRLFAAMADDLDNVALSATGAKKRAALLSKKFLERSKLEFAVKELEEITSGAVKSLKGEGADVVINAKTVLDRLRALTDPKHAAFDKNFTDALKNELPKIRKFFETANELGHLTPAGPGSLVIRQRFSHVGASIGGAIGAAIGSIGGVTGSLVGATLAAGPGAAIGASAPEYLIAGLLSPRGRRTLEFAMRRGRGTINAQAWATVTQIVNKTATESARGAKRRAQDFFGIPGAREILQDPDQSLEEKIGAAMGEGR